MFVDENNVYYNYYLINYLFTCLDGKQVKLSKKRTHKCNDTVLNTKICIVLY